MFKVLLSLFVLTSSLYSANQSRLQNVPQRKALEFSPKQQEQQLAIQQQYSCFLRQLCHQLASASAPTLSRQTHVSSQDTTTPQLVVSAPASKQSTTPRRTSSTNSVNVLLEAANIETSNVLLEAANVFL